MKKKIWLFLLVFLMLLNVTYWYHYVSGIDSVDEGEIRWWWYTKYSSLWWNAIYKWNTLGEIYIWPDNSQTYEDVRVSDVYYPDETWRWERAHWRWGTDTIKYNTYTIDNGYSWYVPKTIIHELWHALGLDHSYHWNIMYAYPDSQSYLWNQDERDYDYLWWN